MAPEGVGGCGGVGVGTTSWEECGQSAQGSRHLVVWFTRPSSEAAMSTPQYNRPDTVLNCFITTMVSKHINF
jgi:hypothetical protein